jgi:cyanophycinase
MKGLIALVGAGEYLPVMNEVDRYLLAHCGADGRVPRVVCLPTAAGQEGESSWQRWNRMGLEHFHALGADVTALPVIDRVSADSEEYAAVIEAADLIYFSGGDPGYLHKTMHGSKAWAAVEKAWQHGAVYAGCSAGAMILGTHMPDIRMAGFRRLEAFGLIDAHIVIPHFDRMPIWSPMMLTTLRSGLKPEEFALGIDEDTALIGIPGAEWHAQGRLKVHVITKKEVKSYSHGEAVLFPS